MLAKDIMRKNVVSVPPQMTLRQVAKLFSRRGISGAPVVSTEGKLIGVISQTDLIGQKHEAPGQQTKSNGILRGKSNDLRVEQAMTPYGVSFEEDTPVPELARQMLMKRIHRVVITRAGEICGIVTTMDMMRALLTMIGS